VAAILLIFLRVVRGLTTLYGDKASISSFIFFLNRPFPFYTCISARPKAGALLSSLASPKGRHCTCCGFKIHAYINLVVLQWR